MRSEPENVLREHAEDKVKNPLIRARLWRKRHTVRHDIFAGHFLPRRALSTIELRARDAVIATLEAKLPEMAAAIARLQRKR